MMLGITRGVSNGCETFCCYSFENLFIFRRIIRFIKNWGIVIAPGTEKLPKSDRGRLFILSFHQRDALANALADSGWQVISARRDTDIDSRFIESGAQIALVDLRNELIAGLEAIRELSTSAEANGLALLVILDDNHADCAAAAYEAGATHVVENPDKDIPLTQHLQFASRYVTRLRGEFVGNKAANEGQERKDYLSGLENGPAARKWLDTTLEAGELPVNIILLGLRRFDQVNAAYGRAVGDALIGRVARRIQLLVQDEIVDPALVARIAGKEFMVACQGDVDIERLRLLTRELIANVTKPFPAGDHIIRLSVRAAIAQSNEDESGAALLRRASLALANAMSADAGGPKLVDASNHHQVAPDADLESDLRRALDQDQISVVFQPQFDVRDGKLVGAEALARWNHPKYGALGAATLFSVAERSEYMAPLSAHIQKLALTYASKWPAALSDLRLSINITAYDLAEPAFLENLEREIAHSGFSKDQLTVEITESGLISDIGNAAKSLQILRETGIKVAVDDFGTGYSSLAYLKALPLDYVKMDSGLTQDIDGTDRDQVVVRAVIDMARSLNLSVIAEGVETESQLALLDEHGCQYFQGFLRAGALSPEEFANFALRSN